MACATDANETRSITPSHARGLYFADNRTTAPVTLQALPFASVPLKLD
jgi:hypothetical protein